METQAFQNAAITYKGYLSTSLIVTYALFSSQYTD